MINFLKTHKMSVLSALLMVVAAALGADCGFAMAVDPVDLADAPNPSGTMEPATYDGSGNVTNGGRPQGESLQEDEQGGLTQLQNNPSSGTNVSDAGLEAEDYDPVVDNFRKYEFPTETLIARRCRPVKVKSYIHGHYNTGSTDLEAIYTGSAITITAGSTVSGVYNATSHILTLPVSDFDNPECLIECSTVFVRGAAGYKGGPSAEVSDGELALYVLDHKDTNSKVSFYVVNPPLNTTGTASTSVIAANSSFVVMATAGSESQMHVPSESYLPEKFDVFLQKKITTCIITDYFDEQTKKISLKTKNILDNAAENFKRKCARSHLNGTMKRFQVFVPETGGRENVFTENGILRQINMLYTHGAELTDDDLLALSTLMFTKNSQTNEATALCGSKAMQRFIKLVNSADKYKDVGKVEVNEYGISVRYYRDNFGSFEFIWEPQLDDLGYEEYMAIVDFKHATRPYMLNDKKTTRDMSKTGEAREAKEHNLCRIDCVALNGFNSILVCPSSLALSAVNTGGITASFQSVSALPSGSALTAAAKLLKYYLTADDATAKFNKGDVVEWSTALDGWVKFQGMIR